jgi:hypothetical protein
VVSTDKGLVQLLDRQSSHGMLDELSARNRLALLELFSMRRHLNDIVRSLPLFLLSAPEAKYTSLASAPPICLRSSNSWAPRIVELKIPGINSPCVSTHRHN